eukprot:1063404-Pelagomonas_calceolata.AAC.2
MQTGTPGDEGAGIAAVLVEASKFYYVYGWVGTGEEYGVQQVVDMELQMRAANGKAAEECKAGAQCCTVVVLIGALGALRSGIH